MRAIRSWVVCGCLVVSWAISCGAQSNITLVAEADTCIRENNADSARPTSLMEVRSLTDPGRQNIAYIRFDLRELADAPQTGVVFSVTRDGGGGTWTSEIVQVYGLLDTFGNTPQGWVDSGLTYNSSGLEVPGDGDATTQDLDAGRLQHVGNLPISLNTSETLSLSGAALDAFLTDRYNNGGLATLMVVAEAGSGTEVRFTHTENTGSPPPSLQVVGDLQEIPADTTPPTVAGSTPVPGATGAGIATVVTATFSEEMDATSIDDSNVFSLLDNTSSLVAATYVYNAGNLTMTLTPSALLEPGVAYTATVLGGASGVTDAAGNPMATDFSWSFTTEAETIPPTVVSVSPTNETADVDAGIKVEVTFDEDMAPASISTSSFYLLDASDNAVAATVAYDEGSRTATLFPSALLKLGRSYTASVLGGPGGVTDLIGNPMAADYSWSFTVSELLSTVRLNPDADARLANDTNRGPTSSTGNDSTYECRWHEAPRVRIAYIRYDITGIDPALFPSATISGTFSDSGRNGPAGGTGLWNVYGLNDDVVADGAGRLGNDWPESDVNYSNAGGVDNALPVDSFAFTDSTFLGTITLTGEDVQPLPFSSSTGDLDLTEFLNADTDGLVTLMWINATMDGYEYRINSKEGSTADGHGPTTLNFDPAAEIIDVALVDGSSVMVTWGVRTNHTYGVERSMESPTASNWVAIASNLVGESVNSYTDPSPGGAQVSYRVLDEGAIPPVEFLFEDFESDIFAKGWMVVTGASHQAGTDWEWGTPTSGPGDAQEGTGAAGTNLGGEFGPFADISLVSPVVDMAGATVANLYFGNFYDCDPEPFDGCEVYVRDETGAAITGLEPPIATYSNFITSWTTAIVALPEAALDRTIRLEFRFYSDDSNAGPDYAGWFIDNVLVTDE